MVGISWNVLRSDFCLVTLPFLDLAFYPEPPPLFTPPEVTDTVDFFDLGSDLDFFAVYSTKSSSSLSGSGGRNDGIAMFKKSFVSE